MPISGNNITPDTTPPANAVPRVSRDDTLKGQLEDRMDGAILGTLNYLVSSKRAGSLTVRSGALIVEATPASGGLFTAIANPCGAACWVHSFAIDVTTPSTGAATADIGVAANATTSADTVIDGVDIGTAAIVADSGSDPGTNGGAAPMSTTQFLTGTASADTTALVGTFVAVFLNP